MMSQAANTTDLSASKHLLIFGGREADRLAVGQRELSAVRASVTRYTLPSGISTYEGYLRALLDLFPIESPLGIPKREMTLDQISDVQLDWVDGSVSVVVFWPEVLLERENLVEALGVYLTQKYIVEEYDQSVHRFRLIATVPRLPKHFAASIPLYFGKPDSDPRSEEQITSALLSVQSL